jgi:hypothetical protein
MGPLCDRGRAEDVRHTPLVGTHARVRLHDFDNSTMGAPSLRTLQGWDTMQPNAPVLT